MRRLLDLNQPSVAFLKIIVLFVAVIPAILFLVAWLLDSIGVRVPAVQPAALASLVLGLIVLAILLGLIVLEQVQDHYFNAHYQRQRAHKLPLAEGNYECQYCGNRQVQAEDSTCAVCGTKLSEPLT